jgi:hypothetical protein
MLSHTKIFEMGYIVGLGCAETDGLVGVGLAAAAAGVVASGIAAIVLGSRRR